MKKIIAILLSFVIAFSSTVIATAAEGNFITVSVNTYNDKGEIETDEEVLYTDGKYLYATPDFLENYTAYYYDDENNAFVRSGQKYKLALSSTTVDYKGKNATVKMMSNSKSYTLHNVFTFGEEQYLPLDQMAAFLKVELMVDGTSIMLLNSGYSIADASYCFNEYSSILNYSNIVNDIFMGNELLYESYAVLCYFSNTIFGLRVSNLLGSYGQASLYENTLTKCVADNSEFIKAQKDENSFTKKCQEASSLIENATKINKTFKNITTVVKNTYETFGDTKDIANIDIEYIDAKEWGEVFSTLSKCYSYMDFFVKSLSMIEDHKEMLTTAKYYYSGSETNSFNTGLACTYKKFGEDTFNGLIETISESLISDLPKNAVAKFAANAVPYTAVIKGVNAFFKLCGFDLTDSTAYSILFDSDIAMKITDMSTSFENNAGKSKKDTEKYRTSAIFALLAMKHAYETGNKLNKKLGGSDAIYENQITELSARLQLYYRASESEGYDDLDSIISLVGSNQKNIELSNIISKAKTINTNDKDESKSLIEKISSGKWVMINEYYNGHYDVVYQFSKDGQVIEEGLRSNTYSTTNSFKYDTVSEDCITFSTGDDLYYAIYATDSENLMRFESKIYGRQCQGLLVKENDIINKSKQILNILAGGCWYSKYYEQKYTTDMVRAEGDGQGNTTINLGFFGEEKYVEGRTLFGKGISDNLALFVPSEYVNKNVYIFIERVKGADYENAYIFDDGKYVFETWESYFSGN